MYNKEIHDSEILQTICQFCGKILYPRYDLSSVKKVLSPADLTHRGNSMWRYFEVLPIRDRKNLVTLGEGGTPLLRADNLGNSLGCSDLYIKDEGVNPSASFKVRGMSAAVSRAKELGARRLVVPSAGNAARGRPSERRS